MNKKFFYNIYLGIYKKHLKSKLESTDSSMDRAWKAYVKSRADNAKKRVCDLVIKSCDILHELNGVEAELENEH